MSTPSNSRDSNNTSPTLDFDDVNQAFIATPSPSLQSPSPIRVRINNDKGENGKIDIWYVDTNYDGKPDASGIDTNGDGKPDKFKKIS